MAPWRRRTAALAARDHLCEGRAWQAATPCDGSLALSRRLARALGGDYKLEIVKGYPSLYNAPEVAGLIRNVTREMLTDDGFYPEEAGMGAEDFSYMAQKAPGAMFMLGAKYDDTNRPHHSPIFDIAETPFAIGAAIFAETAVRMMKK